jgi:hypothetical protein
MWAGHEATVRQVHSAAEHQHEYRGEYAALGSVRVDGLVEDRVCEEEDGKEAPEDCVSAVEDLWKFQLRVGEFAQILGVGAVLEASLHSNFFHNYGQSFYLVKAS